jgi:ABC-type glycerol-3-phosphate transport system permease component
MSAQSLSPGAASGVTKPVRIRNYKLITSRAFSYLILTVTAAMFVYPLVWLLSSSLKPPFEIYQQPLNLIPSEVRFDAYDEIFRATPLLRYFTNSLLYAVGGTLLSLSFGLLAAYGLSRHEFKGKRLLMIAILALQLIPPLISVIPTYLLMQSLGLYNTRVGIIALYGALSIPWAVWVLKGYFDTLPRELDESAAIDGASRLTTVLRILLPIMVPGLAASFIIIFIGRWGEFALASVLLRNQELYSLTVGTYTLLGPDEQDFRLLAAASLINIVPVLVVFSVLQRYLVSGLASGAVKQ